MDSSSPSSRQDEGVLHDVLQELDKERTRRAECESHIRILLEELNALKVEKAETQRHEAETAAIAAAAAAARQNHEPPPTRQDMLAVQTELRGYQELVEALTATKPAIQAARNAQQRSKTKSTLPLHVVRLLEVMPWHASCAEYVTATETIWEWQTYEKGAWQSHLRHFPLWFKSLPVYKGNNNGNDDEAGGADRKLLAFLARGDPGGAPSKFGVMTDTKLSKLFKLEDGYPMPNHDGCVWEWISSWRLEKRIHVVASGSRRTQVDCDGHGWSYAREPMQFLLNPTEFVYDNPYGGGVSSTLLMTRKMRRRQWVRTRVLVDYRDANERSRQYLTLLAEKRRQEQAAHKVADQLVETKMLLTESEAKLTACQDHAATTAGVTKSTLPATGSTVTTTPVHASSVTTQPSHDTKQDPRSSMGTTSSAANVPATREAGDVSPVTVGPPPPPPFSDASGSDLPAIMAKGPERPGPTDKSLPPGMASYKAIPTTTVASSNDDSDFALGTGPNASLHEVFNVHGPPDRDMMGTAKSTSSFPKWTSMSKPPERKASEDLTSSADSDDELDIDDSERCGDALGMSLSEPMTAEGNKGFDWKSIGRTSGANLMGKIRQQQQQNRSRIYRPKSHSMDAILQGTANIFGKKRPYSVGALDKDSLHDVQEEEGEEHDKVSMPSPKWAISGVAAPGAAATLTVAALSDDGL